MKTTSILTSAALLFTAVILKAAPFEPPATITYTINTGNNYIAPALVLPLVDCRRPTVATAAVLTFLSASWSPGAFNNHYVELSSGPGEGRWANIISNTATTLTVAEDFTAFSPLSHDFIIREHVTLGTFLAAGGGLVSHQDLVSFEPPGAPPGSLTAAWQFNGTDWEDVFTLASGNDVVIPPDKVLTVHAYSPSTVTWSGYVRQNKICCQLSTGWQLVPQPAKPTPTPIPFSSWTLGASSLDTLGVILVMVRANYNDVIIPPLVLSFLPTIWSPTAGAGTVMTAGRAAYVFVPSGSVKWCR